MGALIRSLVVQRAWWLVLWTLYGVITALFLQASLAGIRQHNLELATTGARNVFKTLVITRQWNAERGGVYVPVSPSTQPNPYLKHPRRDIHTADGKALTMINPAFMTRMISDMTKMSQGLTFRSTSLKPINPDNAPDAWEHQALKQLSDKTTEVKTLTESADGRPVFRYLAPLWVTEECLDCHREQGYKVGDLRGGISISQDFSPFIAAAAPSERTSILAHLGVFALLVAISGWSLALLRRSWIQLEDNIEELSKTRNELLQSEKMASLGRMVAGFAHEINTPIGIAVGAVSHTEETLSEIDRLLTNEEVDEADLREKLAGLRSGGELATANLKRASSMVQRFKRSSIDQMSEERRVFALRELIEDVEFSLKGQLRKGPVSVSIQCPAGLRINGIPGLLEQLLTNLMMNSLQHGFADGSVPGSVKITVSLPAPSTLRISYSDNGAGMSTEVAERIFEPFFTTRRGSGGSGLGMFLCYNIVTSELGGSIHCTGSPGQGVSFEITIPCEIAGEEKQS
ncbi:MAG: two-component system, NtrC family, sensor kinase [Pseudomonadota bacterium]|nr:two-component system, NtrC family, sensor kinase [Pseudomonadota bacterium]